MHQDSSRTFVGKHLWFIISLSLCSLTFLRGDLASFLSIFSLFPLVLKQAVYCVCSAEQPALKALCVCVFVPVSLSDHVNPLRGLAHLLPCCFSSSLSPPISIGLCCLPQPPDMLSHLSVTPSCTSMWASRTGGNSPLTSQDQTAITNAVTHCLEPLATSRSMSNSWPTRRENKEEQCV